MIIIYGIVLILYFALFLLAAGRRPPPLEAGRKPGLFDKAADYIYGFCKKRRILHQEGAKKSFQVLYPEIGEKREREEAHLRQYYIRKYVFCYCSFFLGICWPFVYL